MFEKGEYIVYGTAGICKVADIIPMESMSIKLDHQDKNRLYYVLHPYNQTGSKIFTPVDNNKTVMRKVISSERVKELVNDIQNMDEIWCEDDRLREQKYKEILKTCDCHEWMRMIKTLYHRKEDREVEGKKISSTDAKYLKIAEDNLLNEFSIPLAIPKEEVKEYIKMHINE